MDYMKANVTINRFYAGDGVFIDSEKSAIAFRNLEQLERIMDSMKSHSIESENIELDIIIDSIEDM